MRVLLIAGFLLLQGCFGLGAKPEVETVYTPVEVPGPVVPCRIDTPEAPIDLVDRLTETDDLHYKAKTLLADRDLKKAYIIKLETAINTCNRKD